ncbi:MAG: helix-turn-helix transcriptional regulator [Helicobacteraceae bacterium]|jgi:transcriptional regulator with XRE-family HTH domain|nr:helix-turn-helix transcriptional regulator [Helicobacteraceae bacterium]
MTHNEYKKRAFAANDALKTEYDALEPEYQVMKAAIDARLKRNLTQQELAKRIGTSQANISKLERGELNPSIAFLKRLAKACDMRLTIAVRYSSIRTTKAVFYRVKSAQTELEGGKL